MKKITKHYFELLNGERKYFDWSLEGYREAQKYLVEHKDEIVKSKENPEFYTLYTIELDEEV